MERPIPKSSEVYRHFKGKLYLIITIAKHYEKYPDVKQKWRFEKVDLSNNE